MKRALALSFVLITAAACNRADAPPSRFGFGRAATPAEIQTLDIDVGPDGVGLPAGQGTAVSGAPVYAAKCATCHGSAGEGTPIAAALVGRIPNDSFNYATSTGGDRRKTVGSWWPHATTLYDYIRRAMPFDKPGTLTPDEIYAVTAFLLAKNEIVKDDFVIDVTSLPAVKMPSRDRFVADDREKSNRVR
ncbi:MAG: hypothetical protein CK531_09070 [Gemmatimonadetes bacterium]|nr:MAG: hypothetical protein CK531_09070 [Gemmatimonadota bacterium]